MDQIHNLHMRNLDQQDLEHVAKIHISAFPDSALSLFGSKAITKYYTWQMTPPNVCYAMGAFSDDKLLGFGFAGKLKNAEIYFIQKYFFYFLWELFLHPSFFFHKVIRERFQSIIANITDHYFRNKKIKKNMEPKKVDRFGILSIAVEPFAQRCGVGIKLMEEIEKIAQNDGYQFISLSVHPENLHAVSFYEKIGWSKVIYDPDKPWQGYMEKILDKGRT